MRDTKSSFLLGLSLFLLSLSLILLSIWGYHFYTTTQQEKVNTLAIKNKQSSGSATVTTIRDSLQKIYTSTIDKLDNRIDSTKNTTDSLPGNVTIKLGEINQLKEDIATILKNKISFAELDTARQKIDELQIKVAQLQNHSLDVEKENKRLSALLQQLINDKNGADKKTKQSTIENKLLIEKTGFTPVFFVTDLRLSALGMNGENEATWEADKIAKITGSFLVKSNTNQNNTAEVMVVVLQPNGQVFQNSTWESGIFETPGGKKIYTHKIRFSYSKSEAKRLLFTLNAENFQQGNYTVQIYYNGSIIGRLVKVLS
jgi:hypothetical protein